MSFEAVWMQLEPVPNAQAVQFDSVELRMPQAGVTVSANEICPQSQWAGRWSRPSRGDSLEIQQPK